jgi:hypothetical protein
MNNVLRMLLLGALMWTPAVWAEPEEVVAEAGSQQAQSVTVELMVVHAVDSGKEAFDPQLNSLKKHFKNYNFSEITLIDSQSGRLEDNTAKTFAIEGNRKVTVSMLSHNDKSARLKVVILEGKDQKILDTTLSINRNGTLIVAGPKYKGGILFLPISAKY